MLRFFRMMFDWVEGNFGAGDPLQVACGYVYVYVYAWGGFPRSAGSTRKPCPANFIIYYLFF